LPYFGIPTFATLLVHYRLGHSMSLGVAIIDTTCRCNLSCSVCYYKRHKSTKELSLSEWKIKLLELKKKGTAFVTWTGGEPLLRPEVIELGRRIFPFNTVFTNGTNPIPDWQDVVFYVSIDGTKTSYEKIRGKQYETVKSTIRNSSQPVIVTMVINKVNKKCIENYLDEWLKEPNVRAVAFSFYTGSETTGYDELLLRDGELQKIVERLKKAKRKYGESLIMTEKMADLFLPQNRLRAVGLRCVVKSFTCLDAEGKNKLPCSMTNSNCERCGQFIPYAFTSIFQRGDIELVNLVRKLWIRV